MKLTELKRDHLLKTAQKALGSKFVGRTGLGD